MNLSTSSYLVDFGKKKFGKKNFGKIFFDQIKGHITYTKRGFRKRNINNSLPKVIASKYLQEYKILYKNEKYAVQRIPTQEWSETRRSA